MRVIKDVRVIFIKTAFLSFLRAIKNKFYVLIESYLLIYILLE